MKIDEDLLRKFFAGACTPEEMALVKSYINQSDQAELDAILAQDWQDPEVVPDPAAKAEVWKRLQAHSGALAPPQPAKVRSFRYVYAVAASIVLLLAVGLGSQLLTEKSQLQEMVVNDSHQPLPITLADQSEVWLTPGSQLVYPRTFASGRRVVHLVGEGFFKVTSDTTRPFLVQTDGITTRVLGTSFDVRAYPEQDYVEVALLSGSVRMEQHKDEAVSVLSTIKPGEKFYYDKVSDTYHQDTIASAAVYGWQDGIIQFEGTGIDRVAETLANWYDISVRRDSSLKRNERLFFRIDTKSMTLEEVVAGINLVAAYHQYDRVNDSTFVIKSKDPLPQ